MVLMSRQNDTEVEEEPLSWCSAKEDTQPVKAKAGCGVGAAIMSACCLASGDGVGWDGGFGQEASRKGVEC